MARRRPRDPAKHSKKDPAKPTRAKAARPDASPIDPALADLLNPAIGQGRAGVGSQTGIEPRRARDRLPPPLGEGRPRGRSEAASDGIRRRSNAPHARPLARHSLRDRGEGRTKPGAKNKRRGDEALSSARTG